MVFGFSFFLITIFILIIFSCFCFFVVVVVSVFLLFVSLFSALSVCFPALINCASAAVVVFVFGQKLLLQPSTAVYSLLSQDKKDFQKVQVQKSLCLHQACLW